ncbi:STAS domain-containing protein [Paracidovorax citrulli]
MPTLDQRSIDLFRSEQGPLLTRWTEQLAASGQSTDRRMGAAELHNQTREFLQLFLSALATANVGVATSEWEETRRFLAQLSRDRALKGYSSSETASFLFSLKRPLFELTQKTFSDDPVLLGEQLWVISELIDSLGLHSVQVYQKTREEVIQRQQEEMLELSTPVVKLWEGVLALPMIGTLDSQRTQVVMESLLERIVETGSEIAIIDITGVPTVDTLVAQHLLKTVTAIRLMGADAIISGVRPQIAQTVVHLGLDLQGVVTKANLADALALALKRTGLTVTQTGR